MLPSLHVICQRPARAPLSQPDAAVHPPFIARLSTAAIVSSSLAVAPATSSSLAAPRPTCAAPLLPWLTNPYPATFTLPQPDDGPFLIACDIHLRRFCP